MRSLFARFFSNLIISSLGVLVTMALIAVFAVNHSVSTWNMGKKTDLENLLRPIVSRVYRMSGSLERESLHTAIEPYMTDTLYVYIFDAEKKPLLLLDKGSLISVEEFQKELGSVSSFLRENPPVELIDGSHTVGYMAVSNVDFYAYKANRNFVSTIVNVASVGIVITTGLSLVLALVLSSSFSRQTKSLVSGIQDLSNGKRQVEFPQSTTLELETISRSAQMLQRQLEKEETLREQWMQDISHDLRTPITAIKAQLEAMHDGVLPITSERIGRLMAELERVEFLVRDLSELSRYESPEMRITPQLLFSSDFMDDMRERFAFLCSQKGISFLFNSAAFSYYADEHLLQRCVSNIIQNAIQHTEAGGQISVNFYDRDSQAVLEVRNSGHIDERHLEHVFDRFYRGDKARHPSGSGLGLPIVKAIMNLHNGTVEVKNCGDMVCVTLTFPEIFDLL